MKARNGTQQKSSKIWRFVSLAQGRANLSESYVSVIGIPAVGADPIATWTANPHNANGAEPNTEDGDAQGDFPSASLMQTETSRSSTRSHPPIWIIHDIRTVIPTARVILYDHGEPEEGVTLKGLAGGLLRCLHELREPGVSRPHQVWTIIQIVR